MKHSKNWIQVISFFILIVSAFIHSAKLLRIDVMQWLANTFQSSLIVYILYILVTISALLHVVSRDYYLPFLGPTAFPCGFLEEKTPKNPNTKVTVNVDPNSSVVYWAAEENEKIQENPWVAYDKFSNAGVTQSDSTGKAVLQFRKPSGYRVMSGTLKPHVHYRVCKSPGMLGAVQTYMVNAE
jgi:hypothetical protein